MSNQFSNQKHVFGQYIGRYQLLEKLGEGGMATVYNAYDTRFEQNVALKIILPSHQSSKVFLEQFEIEAKMLAQLSHSNIVKVLDYGEEKGQPYLVMEFIQGGTLKDSINGPLHWKQAASILLPIARALDYVHKQNLIHRDVKPANILIDENDQPKLSDFGIVQIIEVNEELPGAIGVGVGTPDYMSPEQCMGKQVSFSADVYALGVVLFELITGQKPFTAETPLSVSIKHVTEPFPHPRSINKKIPKFVESVILKAVQKDPQKRFKNMATFAEALEILAGKTKTPQKQIIKLLREEKQKTKNRILNFGLAAGILLMLFAITFLINYKNVIRTLFGKSNSVVSEQQTNDIQLTLKAIVDNKMQTEIADRYLLTPQKTPPVNSTSNPSLIDTNTSIPFQQQNYIGPSLVSTPVNVSEQYQTGQALWGIGGVNNSCWSPDGKQIALGTSEGIFIFQTDSLEQLKFINPNNWVNFLQYYPDGTQIISGLRTENGLIEVYSNTTGENASQFFYSNPNSERLAGNGAGAVVGLTTSPNFRYLAAGYESGAVNIWDINKNNVVFKVDQYDPVTDLAFSRDNRYLYVANGKKSVNVWDIASGKSIKQISSTFFITKLVSFSDADILLMSGNSNSGIVWDSINDKILASFLNLGSEVQEIDYSKNGNYVAFGLKNGDINIFKIPDLNKYYESNKPLYTLKGHPDTISSLAFSPNSPILASTSRKVGLILWDMSDGSQINSLEPNIPATDWLSLSLSNEWLAVGDIEEQVRIWNIPKGIIAYQFKGHLPLGQIFSQNSEYLAILRNPERFYGESNIEIIRLSDGTIIKELSGFQQGWTLNFSPDEALLVAGDMQRAIFWDVSTWQKIKTYGGVNSGLGEFLTLDKQKIASINKDNITWNNHGRYLENSTTHEFTKENWGVLSSIPKPIFPELNLLASSNGDLIATGDSFGTIRIWKK